MSNKLFEASLAGALLRYRVMAYVVGVFLLVLACVAVPLQYAANNPTPAAVIGPIHGGLYIVYLAASYDLVRRAGWKLRRMVAPVFAGFVPVMAFVIERRTTRQVTEVLDATTPVH